MYQNIPRGGKPELDCVGTDVTLRQKTLARLPLPAAPLPPITATAVLPGPATHPPQSLVHSPPRQFQKQEQSACLTLSHQNMKHWYFQT